MKMLPLRKPENKRTSTEKAVRNCVFMFVIVYVASLIGLFLNSQVDVVNAESDLVSTYLSANVNIAHPDSSNQSGENSDLENLDLEDLDLESLGIEL